MGHAGAAGASQKAWIGAAVAIKEPTFASFGRHAGSNLLVVGAWEESALGVLANAVIALAAQNREAANPQRVRNRQVYRSRWHSAGIARGRHLATNCRCVAGQS